MKRRFSYKEPIPAFVKTMSKRRFMGALFGILVSLPIGRIIVLRSLDNPLPKIAVPQIVIVDGWGLDQSDINIGDTE